MHRTGRALAGVAGTALLALVAATGQARADASVVTSIKPIHSLAAAVMAGVGEPFLIVKSAGSPHSYTMRPSEARALQEADVVFWVGRDLEAFLAKPIAALGDDARVVSLADAEGVRLLEARAGGSWDAHDHDEHEQDDDHHHDEHADDVHHDEHADDDHHGEHDEHGADHADEGAAHGKDMHLWLDPDNARAMVRAMAAALSAADPTNAERYRANAEATIKRVDALDSELDAQLAPVRGQPYVVFHDAYQYFERHYRLNAVGSITVAPGRNPGARRLYEIRDKIVTLGARCVFAEPQFEPALVATVTEGTAARPGVLDPLGAELPESPDAYFTMMRNLAGSLADCLAPDS